MIRHKEQNISAEIINSSGTFSTSASASEINSDNVRAFYTYDKREQYIPAVKKLSVEENKFTYTFPAHSFTQIILKIE